MMEADEVGHAMQSVIVIDRFGDPDHEVCQVLLPIGEPGSYLMRRLDVLRKEGTAGGVVERDEIKAQPYAEWALPARPPIMALPDSGCGNR
jgi:hypothetical protein